MIKIWVLYFLGIELGSTTSWIWRVRVCFFDRKLRKRKGTEKKGTKRKGMRRNGTERKWMEMKLSRIIKLIIWKWAERNEMERKGTERNEKEIRGTERKWTEKSFLPREQALRSHMIKLWKNFLFFSTNYVSYLR